MPALKIDTIENAKLGSTDLSAVYQGSALVWSATPKTSVGNVVVSGPTESEVEKVDRYMVAADGDANPKAFKWSVVGGNISGSGLSIQVHWLEAGVGSVTCKVTSTDPNVGDSPKSDTVNVTVSPKELITDIQFYNLTTSDSYNSMKLSLLYVSWKTDKRPATYADVPDTLRLQWSDDPATVEKPKWRDINWSQQPHGVAATSTMSAMPPSEDGLMIMVAHEANQAGAFKDRRFRVAVGDKETLQHSEEHVVSGFLSETPSWDTLPQLPIEWLSTNRDGELRIVTCCQMHWKDELWDGVTFEADMITQDMTCQGFKNNLEYKYTSPKGNQVLTNFGQYFWPENPVNGKFPCTACVPIIKTEEAVGGIPVFITDKSGKINYSKAKTTVKEFTYPADQVFDLICTRTKESEIEDG